MQVKVWFQNRRMKRKKIQTRNNGPSEDSPPTPAGSDTTSPQSLTLECSSTPVATVGPPTCLSGSKVSAPADSTSTFTMAGEQPQLLLPSLPRTAPPAPHSTDAAAALGGQTELLLQPPPPHFSHHLIQHHHLAHPHESNSMIKLESLASVISTC